MDQKIFKAYDIRGKYPNEINEKVVAEIVGVLEEYFLSKVNGQWLMVKIIIGRDARLSSPKLYRAAIRGLTTNDQRPTIVPAGIITTPMLYFLVNHFNADLGIMITASHNPKEYNGLKIVGKKAVPISGKEVQKLVISN